MLTAPMPGLPFHTVVVSDRDTLTPAFEGYFKGTDNNINSLKNRGYPCFLYNPDFNLLSANGTNPVTPAAGSDFEFLDKWFVVNGGGSNDYTLTPRPYLTISNSPSGSNYYLSVVVTDQSAPLYFYNVNYSSTGQFDSVGKYSAKKLTFSVVVVNNLDNLPEINISADINGVDEIHSGSIYLQPGVNQAAVTIEIPDLTGESYAVPPYTQFRLNILDIDGGMDCDFGYIKGEISNYPSILDIDHIVEQLRCNALT